MEKRYARCLIFIGILISCLIGVVPGYSEEKTLWQIGTFDQSSEEF